jgi:hypothetical protein
MFLTFLLSDLGSESLHVAGLTGVGFVAGSSAAAAVTRRRELLLVVIMPPVIFLVAVTCGELMSLRLNHVTASAGRTVASVFLTLSGAAPWLFGGFVAALVIATIRGLPSCVRELRAELTGRR